MFSPEDLAQKSHSKKACAIMGPHSLFLDHTAPICAFLKIPLLTNSVKDKFQYERLYPDLTIKVKNWTLDYLMQNYSTIFYGFRPYPSFAKQIEMCQKVEPHNPLWKKKVSFIYHLHGCSDKGYYSDWLSPNNHFLDADKVLIYGQRMLDIFKDNDILDRLKSYSLVGNYRYTYFLKHKTFYRNLIQNEVLSKFEKKQTTFLYAPSWNDPEDSCSLFKACTPILNHLPSDVNLILKLHPYLLIETPLYDPTPLKELLAPFLKKKNLLILTDFPLIYPLLDQVDAYIGDYSSIGYDALTFNLPLFFLNHNHRKLSDKGAYLFNCGTQFFEKDYPQLFSKIKNKLSLKNCPFSEQKKEIYKYAYGAPKSFSKTEQMLRSFTNG